MVGDPTQSLMGAEKPFEGRLRVSADFLSRTESLGVTGLNHKEIDEQRLTLSLAYAPDTRWMIGLNLPFASRQLTAFNLSTQEVSAPGDVTLTAKYFMQEKTFLQKHMYGLLAGVKLPTAAEIMDGAGAPLAFDVQAGQGATVLNVGAWYAHFNYPSLFYASTAYHIASGGYLQFQAGNALAYNVTAQYSSSQALAWYLGLEGRYSQKDSFAGVVDADSGGNMVFATPGFIYTVTQDLLLNVTVKLPFIKQLRGEHNEDTIYNIGLTYDFDIH